MNSPTIGAAVENLARYLGFHQTGAEISAKQDRRYWRIAYRVLHPEGSDFYQDAECTVGTLIAGMAHVSSGEIAPAEVHFRRKAPAHEQADREALPGVTIRFDQPVDAVLVDPDVANQSVVGADQQLLPILEQHAQLLLELAPGEDELHSRVDQVREGLARQNVARDDVTFTEVAFLLGYSESSAFIRAFRRWTGETPRAYRKRALA